MTAILNMQIFLYESNNSSCLLSCFTFKHCQHVFLMSLTRLPDSAALWLWFVLGDTWSLGLGSLAIPPCLLWGLILQKLLRAASPDERARPWRWRTGDQRLLVALPPWTTATSGRKTHMSRCHRARCCIGGSSYDPPIVPRCSVPSQSSPGVKVWVLWRCGRGLRRRSRLQRRVTIEASCPWQFCQGEESCEGHEFQERQELLHDLS